MLSREINVHGLGGLRCQHFQAAVHLALRTLIDKLGVTSFNVAVTGHNVAQDANRQQPVIARIVNRGSLSSQASDFGGLEVFGAASIGHTDPFLIAEAISENLYMSSVKP
eukprot:jgi/Astpho2/9797/Aster-x0870